MTELKHITFFIDSPLDKFDCIEKMVIDHDITEYLISHEQINAKGEEKPHYHFLLLTTEKVYNNLFKKLKVALGVKPHKATGSGGYRPYGRLKVPIRDLDRLKAYICKDGVVRSTYSEDVLKALHEKSFQKTKTDKFKAELVSYIDEHLPAHQILDKEKFYSIIIQYFLTQDSKITKQGIVSWGTYYIRHTDKLGHKSRQSLIYKLLF